MVNRYLRFFPQKDKEQLVFFPVDEEPSPITFTQQTYFDMFKYRWLAGNRATALNDPFRVVLTEKEATKYFGPEDPNRWLGRVVVYSDSLRVTVSGIVADWKGNSDFAFQDFISYPTIHSSFLKNDYESNGYGMWDYGNYVMVKLAPRVVSQLPAFLDRHLKQDQGDGRRALGLQPLSDIHYNEKYRDAFSRKANLPTLYGLAGIAAFILLIAAINFINLSTAQSVRRSREIGVRKVLGGRRGALIVQFMGETLLLVLAACVLALLIANPLLAAFRSLLPRGVQLEVFQWQTFVFLGAIAFVTCLLAGWYPARVLSSYKPVLSLKGQGIQQLNNKSYLRKVLIVFQFTVSLIFIIGTLIVTRQIHFMMNTDLGFDHDAIVNFRSGPDGAQHRRTVLEDKLRAIPDIKLIARSMNTPLAAGHNGTNIIYHKGMAGERTADASFDCIDTNFLRLYGMHLAAGRDLFASDTLREFLINETCAKQLGFQHPEDAIGKVVDIGMNHGHGPIVGVVKDFHAQTMHEVIKPFFISSYTRAEGFFSIKLGTTGQTGDQLKSTLTQMEKAYAEVYPDRKFEYRFYDETIARLYEKEQKTAALLNIAMGIAIFISCLGLFGLAAFIAEQRTKEIGIRKILGASVANIVGMLSKDFLWLVGIAIVIASPVAWYFMRQWLQDFVYRIPISWWTYAFAGFGAIGIALVTVSFQAIRAATANPVESLKVE
jgi:putative ABC transport system permease protein